MIEDIDKQADNYAANNLLDRFALSRLEAMIKLSTTKVLEKHTENTKQFIIIIGIIIISLQLTLIWLLMLKY